MRINVAIPEAHVEAPVLDAALESVTRLNESMLERNEIPSFERGLKYGVRWKPEPPGAEHFDHAKSVLARKWGDCDDLAPWHAASLRHSGEDPGARAIVKRSGPKMWHAVVQRTDGSIDDPSRRAGMGAHRGIVGAVLPVMFRDAYGVNGAYIVRPKIALRPVRGAFQSRVDIPWHWREHLEDEPNPSDIAMTALHTAPVAQTALVGAIDGALELAHAAGFGHPEHLERLCCVADAVQGVPYRALVEHYGPEHAAAAAHVVGSFFGKLAKGLGNVVKKAAPFASTALQFVPGVGPIASKGLDIATKFIPGGPAGQLLRQVAPGVLQAVAPGGGTPAVQAVRAAQAVPGGVSRICFPANVAVFE